MKKVLVISATVGIFIASAIAWLGEGALLAIHCADSAMVRTKARKLLTPEKLETLRPAGDLCSGTYVFKRNGKNQCIGVDDNAVGGCG